MSERLTALKRWLHAQIGEECALTPASSDASFRRYFRIQLQQGSRIVMDAPPEQEDCRPFIYVAGILRKSGLHVPKVLAEDLDAGFLLLSDLGDTTYLDVLDKNTVEDLYRDAMDALCIMQTAVDIKATELPVYDSTLLQTELNLFKDWYLEKHCGLSLDAQQQMIWEKTCQHLIDSALEQPVVCVHRDYHSRNLMRVDNGLNPGILDFQDAVAGPMTYDLVSLLRDCYISWPQSRVDAWVKAYYQQALNAGIINDNDIEITQFSSWFDLMGVQRHLKAIGIFARLWHRDGKQGYLNDIPRTLGYVLDVCQGNQGLEPFYQLLSELSLPDQQT